MVFLERVIQQIRPEKWGELEVLDKKFDVVERRLGFPPKKRYRAAFGPSTNTLMIERCWESMTAMEAAFLKAFADPEWQALNAEGASIIESNQEELYTEL